MSIFYAKHNTIEICQRLEAIYLSSVCWHCPSRRPGEINLGESQVTRRLEITKTLKNNNLWCIFDWYRTNCVCISAVYHVQHSESLLNIWEKHPYGDLYNNWMKVHRKYSLRFLGSTKFRRWIMPTNNDAIHSQS